MEKTTNNALGEFLLGKKQLFRVTCKRPDETQGRGSEAYPWKEAYVAATSLENAALKAVQYFNQKDGVNDYIATDVQLRATQDGEGDVFID